MKTLVILLLVVFNIGIQAQTADDKSNPNIRQWYSGKFGFYNPSDGLNNGLVLGVDGLTEFLHYPLMISGSIDLYPKRTISIFESPEPDISQQQMLLLPLHLNVGFKAFEIGNADSRGYVGLGGGYYFYFYSLEYRTSSGGVLGTLTTSSDSRNGGGIFGSAFARLLIGEVFIEPRYYFASRSNGVVDGHAYTVNPSGMAITLGFQR